MHGGNIPGSGVTFALYPDDELEVAVISSLDTAPTNRIHDVLKAIVFGREYKLPPAWKEVAVDPKVYDAYVGRYRNVKDAKFVITVTKKNDRLWNRLDDSPAAATMVLQPLSGTKYFNKMFVLYEVSFLKDKEGRVTGLIADGPWGKGEFKRIGLPGIHQAGARLKAPIAGVTRKHLSEIVEKLKAKALAKGKGRKKGRRSRPSRRTGDGRVTARMLTGGRAVAPGSISLARTEARPGPGRAGCVRGGRRGPRRRGSGDCSGRRR